MEERGRGSIPLIDALLEQEQLVTLLRYALTVPNSVWLKQRSEIAESHLAFARWECERRC